MRILNKNIWLILSHFDQILRFLREFQNKVGIKNDRDSQAYPNYIIFVLKTDNNEGSIINTLSKQPRPLGKGLSALNTQ